MWGADTDRDKLWQLRVVCWESECGAMSFLFTLPAKLSVKSTCFPILLQLDLLSCDKVLASNPKVREGQGQRPR